MKHFLLFVFLLSFTMSYNSAISCDFEIINEFELGQQPVRIIYQPDNDLYHVFCNGNDINYNGAFDEEIGEEMPSWWTFKVSEGKDITSQKVMDFNIGFFTPTQFYAGIDFKDGKIYLPFGQKFNESFEVIEEGFVAVYDINTHSLISKDFFDIDPTSVLVHGDLIFISGLVNLSDDVVNVYDKNSYELIDQLPAGPSVQHVVAVDDPQGIIVGVLNEGIFGDNNSTLMTTMLVDGKFSNVDQTDLGDTGHFLLYYGSSFAAVMNGSHEVVIVSDDDVINSIKLETTGYDGPREMAYHQGLFCITSYKGSISFFEQHGNSFSYLQKVDIGRKADALLYNNDLLFVCSPLDVSYEKLKKIYVLQDKLASVDIDNNSGIHVYPNPARDFLNIDSDLKSISGEISFDIVNAQGIIQLSGTFNSSSDLMYQIDLDDLPSGIYFLRVLNGKDYKISQLWVHTK
jgi:hypothetical protein